MGCINALPRRNLPAAGRIEFSERIAAETLIYPVGA
jgi:hypothetical protein